LAAVVSIEGLPNEEVTTDEVVYDGSVAEECHLIKDPTELDIANLSDSDASEDEEADAAGPLLKADAPTYPGKILLLKYRLAVICAVALFKPRAKVKKKIRRRGSRRRGRRQLMMRRAVDAVIASMTHRSPLTTLFKISVI